MKKHFTKYWYLYMSLVLAAVNIYVGLHCFDFGSLFNFLAAGFSLGCGITQTQWRNLLYKSNEWRDNSLRSYSQFCHTQIELLEKQNQTILEKQNQTIRDLNRRIAEARTKLN